MPVDWTAPSLYSHPPCGLAMHKSGGIHLLPTDLGLILQLGGWNEGRYDSMPVVKALEFILSRFVLS